jgi:WD40 repeat protein
MFSMQRLLYTAFAFLLLGTYLQAEETSFCIELPKPKGLVHSAAFSPDGKKVVTESDDQTSRIWNAN